MVSAQKKKPFSKRDCQFLDKVKNLMKSGDYAGAVQMFHRAISDGYANPHILYGQAVLCAYMNGDYDQAAADGEKAIRGAEAAGENTGELHLWTGLACMVREDYGPASEHFRSAAEQDDSLQDLRYYLGICALAEGDPVRAEEWFTASVERDENVTASMYNRAVCRLQQGLLDEAKADLTAVTERNDDPDLTAQAGGTAGAAVNRKTIDIPGFFLDFPIRITQW